MDDPTPLQLATVNELVEELFSRYEHVIFAGMKIDTDQRLHKRWKGNSVMCTGLAHEAAHAVIEAMNDGCTPDDSLLGDDDECETDDEED